MLYTLYGLFVLACIVLVVTVLLQPGKADAGAMFASSVSSTAFGPRGTQTLLAKITIGAAALFMLCALALGLPAIIGTRSVLQSEPEAESQQTTPAASTNTNTASQTVTVPPVTETNANASAANANAAPAAANANTSTKAPAASNTANTKQNQKPPAKKK
ncbi:MAG: preprotein translocase subunit SecG [Acidobacteria bacterium]|nr:preprotein translocase subunit SecG [Acidobacteriota bacterium]